MESKKGVFHDSFSKIFEVSLEPKLKMKEKKLLDKIFKKISNKGFPFELSIGEFYHIYKTKNIPEIKNELLKLSKKKFFFKILENSGDIYSGEFNLISSFYVSERKIIIIPPYEVIDSIKKESIFNRLHFSTYTRFKEKHSFKFYPYILNNLNKSSFDYRVDELKGLLEVKDNYYERFYDFEKKILIPLIDDINKSSDINIRYRKVKKGDGRTSKIEYLTFYILDKRELENTKNISEVLDLVKNKVGNISHIHNLIEEAMKNHSKESLISKVEWIERKFTKPLDIFLEASLSTNEKTENDSLKVIDIEEKFSSHFKFEERIYKEIAKYNFVHDNMFLQELQNLRVKNNFSYVKSPWKIQGEYNKNKESRVRVYIIN